MFQTLEERIQRSQPSSKERLLRYLIMLVISALVLGGLYFALTV